MKTIDRIMVLVIILMMILGVYFVAGNVNITIYEDNDDNGYGGPGNGNGNQSCNWSGILEGNYIINMTGFRCHYSCDILSAGGTQSIRGPSSDFPFEINVTGPFVFVLGHATKEGALAGYFTIRIILDNETVAGDVAKDAPNSVDTSPVVLVGYSLIGHQNV